MRALHRDIGYNSPAIFVRMALNLCMLVLCISSFIQSVHAESISQVGPTFQGRGLSSTHLLSGFALNYLDRGFAEDSIPDYESWTGDSTEGRRSQKPSVALFKSMLVPGLGQLGNRQYIKAALVIGVEGLLFSRWLKFRNETVDARAAFEAQPIGSAMRQDLFNAFEVVKNDRNLYTWLTGTSIFLSMFDAFVDAHLRHFPGPGSEISFGPLQSPRLIRSKQAVIGVTLSFRF